MERQIICGKYLILECLHQSENNTVYLTENQSLHSKRIIKQMKKQENFQLAEVDILKELSHANIPKIIDVLEDDDFIFLIREYAEGQNLEEWAAGKERIEEAEVLRVAEQLAEVLRYLHEGLENPIIYRDLKPENIILDQNQNLFLIDFGIARYATPERKKDTLFLGTKAYAAPEQFGVLRSDEKSDIYAYGMTLYYLISRHKISDPPYKRLEPENWSKFYAEDLIALIYRCSEPQRERRPDSFSEICGQLKELQQKEAGPAALPEQAEVYLGIRRGVGTSFVACAHAFRAAAGGGKTALLDWSESQQIAKLVYTSPEVRVKKDSFMLNGLDIFPSNKDKRLPLKWQEYDRIFIDYGLLTQEKRKILRPFQEQLRFVAAGAAWDMVDLDEVIFNEKLIDGCFILNLADESCLAGLKGEYPETRFELFPYQKSMRAFAESGQEEKQQAEAAPIFDKIRTKIQGMVRFNQRE